ncbi:hypothetical protein NDU88_010903 [Pleurodeles waltl]|uniref:Uncharacterized protein n=1 Tax=Pleurodeles waltl TaxID=8319 RepID=A0AAV7S3W3_PLEWA|nr:hypothetical protein NDU88_010903 [Pleurodeles waltl]
MHGSASTSVHADSTSARDNNTPWIPQFGLTALCRTKTLIESKRNKHVRANGHTRCPRAQRCLVLTVQQLLALCRVHTAHLICAKLSSSRGYAQKNADFKSQAKKKVEESCWPSVLERIQGLLVPCRTAEGTPAG